MKPELLWSYSWCSSINWVERSTKYVLLKKRIYIYRYIYIYIYFICKTLKKEGRAFRNIGKKLNIFPTVKSALLRLFYTYYTYLSNSSFSLPFWLIRSHFNQRSIFFISFSITLAPGLSSGVLKIGLIVRHFSYFKFAARAIKPHFDVISGFLWNRSIRKKLKVPWFSLSVKVDSHGRHVNVKRNCITTENNDRNNSTLWYGKKTQGRCFQTRTQFRIYGLSRWQLEGVFIWL